MDSDHVQEPKAEMVALVLEEEEPVMIQVVNGEDKVVMQVVSRNGCFSVGRRRTCYDSSCQWGGQGCNAGGQFLCRFC